MTFVAGNNTQGAARSRSSRSECESDPRGGGGGVGMTGSTWRFGSRCLCPVLSRMQGDDGLLFFLHILLLLPIPPPFSWKGSDGTLYQEVKGKKWEESAVLSRGEAEEELSGV